MSEFKDRLAYIERENRAPGNIIVEPLAQVNANSQLVVLSHSFRAEGTGPHGYERFRTVETLRDILTGEIVIREYVGERGNLPDAGAAAVDMAALASRTKVRNPVFHGSVNWPRGEQVTDEEMFEAAETVIAEAFGSYAPDVQWQAVIHRDREHHHVHVIANRCVEVEPGRVLALDPSKSYGYDASCKRVIEKAHPNGRFPKRIALALRALERAHNQEYPERPWSHSPGPDSVGDRGRPVSSSERNYGADIQRRIAAYERLSGLQGKRIKSFRAWARDGEFGQVSAADILRAALEQSDATWIDVQNALALRGLRYEVRCNVRGGRRYRGGVIVDVASPQICHMRAQSLGNASEFSLLTLEARLGTLDRTTKPREDISARINRKDVLHELRLAFQSRDADIIEEVAAKHGMGFKKAGGGYRIVDIATRDGVRLSSLGSSFRNVRKKYGLHRDLQMPTLEKQRDNISSVEAEFTYAQYVDAEVQRLRHERGESLANDPMILLRELIARSGIVTEQNLENALDDQVQDVPQIERILDAVRKDYDSGNLVAVRSSEGSVAYTTPEMLQSEQALFGEVKVLRSRRFTALKTHASAVEELSRKYGFTAGQRSALLDVVDSGAATVVQGFPGSGKSTIFKALRELADKGGFDVWGCAFSGRASEGFRADTGIDVRTVDALLLALEGERVVLNGNAILCVDEAGAIGTEHFSRLLAHVNSAGAKIVLMGDEKQLPGVAAGPAWSFIVERYGSRVVYMDDIIRQRDEWRREAVVDMRDQVSAAKGLDAHRERGFITAHPEWSGVVAHVAERYIDETEGGRVPIEKAHVLTFTTARCDEINAAIEQRLLELGRVGPRFIETEDWRGRAITIREGDRLMFRKNDEKRMNVRNGSMGTVERIDAQRILVRLDNGARRSVDPRTYPYLEHAYCLTAYKSQAMTDQWNIVAASRADYLNAWEVYVSRSRGDCEITYACDEFGAPNDSSYAQLVALAGRQREKLFASNHDRLNRDTVERESLLFGWGADHPLEQTPSAVTQEHQSGSESGTRQAHMENDARERGPIVSKSTARTAGVNRKIERDVHNIGEKIDGTTPQIGYGY